MSQRVQQEAQHLVELLASLEGDVGPACPGGHATRDRGGPRGCVQWLVWVILTEGLGPIGMVAAQR